MMRPFATSHATSILDDFCTFERRSPLNRYLSSSLYLHHPAGGVIACPNVKNLHRPKCSRYERPVRWAEGYHCYHRLRAHRRGRAKSSFLAWHKENAIVPEKQYRLGSEAIRSRAVDNRFWLGIIDGKAAEDCKSELIMACALCAQHSKTL